jgi:Rrf2 family protein
MKFSTRTRYGIRAMIELALDTTGEGVFQKDIALRQSISVKYLDQIIHALKAANLIENVKGKKSGYILTRKPAEISIYDIHKALENDICVIDCMSANYECEKQETCTAQNFWRGLNTVIVDYMKNTTLESIVSKENQSKKK